MSERMSLTEAESWSRWVVDSVGGELAMHSGRLSPLLSNPSHRRLARFTGTDLKQECDGMRLICPLCGEDSRPGKCDREKHAAYYDAFPRGAER